MIEEIPNSVKPLLNDFIVAGKRCFMQKKNLVDKINNQIISLHNNI